MSDADAFLRAVRSKPRAADRVVDLYTLVLSVLIFVLPLARWASQQIAPAIAWELGTVEVMLICGVLGLGVVAAGSIRGLVAPTAPYLDLVVAGPQPLTGRLRATWLRGTAGLVALVVFGVAVAMVSRSSWPDPLAAVAMGLVAAGFGVLLALGWLAGQARWWAAAIPAAVLVAAAGWPLAVAWRGLADGPDWWMLLAVLAAVGVVGALGLVRGSLSRLRPADLRSQAVRWSRVEFFATTTDLASAAAELRTPTRRGRHWRPRFAPPALVRRDLIGLTRAPGRTAMGLLCAALAAGAVAPAAEGRTPMLAIGIASIAYVAVSLLSDGLRFHAAERERPSAFGLSPARTAVQHLVVPGVLTALIAGAAGAAAGSAHVAVALALLALACRAMAVFKGHMPLELFTPVMTVGELSSAGRLLWLGDAVLACVLIGATAVSQTTGWVSAGLLLAGAIGTGYRAYSRWRK